MSKRYQFPDSLGNVIHEAANDEPDYPEVGFDLPGFKHRLWLSRKLITEVESPLPVEPPNLTTVLVGEWAYQRDDVGAPNTVQRWHGDEGWFGWRELHENLTGPIVRVVLDPFADPVELPWRAYIGDDREVLVALRGDRVTVTINEHGESCTSPVPARAMARALWTAADQAEAKDTTVNDS